MVGLGGYTPFAWSTQEDEAGKTNTTTFFPMVSVNTFYPIGYQHYFVPEFGFVYHNKNFDHSKKYTFLVLCDVAWPVFSRLVLRYGVGGVWTYISGDGGNISLSNGDSAISFAVPDESSTSFNATLDFGLDFALDSHYTLRGEFFLFGMFSGTSRQYSYLFSVNYYL